jgi:glutathione S-transferase
MKPITLYGGAFSLYTGRARSYLIKSRIDYREEPHASEHYYNIVLPKAGGRRGVPTVEFANGDVIRDGVAIIDHFESLNGSSHAPVSPKQRIVSLLLDVIGAEGMLRPCMHYRFNHDEEDSDFLPFQFASIYLGDREAAKDRMEFIRSNVLPAWGVTPENGLYIEANHLETLEKLNAHFSLYPYFLGGKPCIGDFGMMAPLYGHLGRDPTPLSLMQRHAVRLFRWVERMNRAEPDIGEFADKSTEYLSDDLVPQTLVEVLKHFASDFVPETQAACDCINQWLAENPDVPSGTEVERHLGFCDFSVQGLEMNAAAQPFRFYLLKRVQDEYQSLGEAAQRSVLELLKACDMEILLELKISRDIGRENNLEVWL